LLIDELPPHDIVDDPLGSGQPFEEISVTNIMIEVECAVSHDWYNPLNRTGVQAYGCTGVRLGRV
jgi:hypothetical protein